MFFFFFISQLLERNQGLPKNVNDIKQDYDKRLGRLDPKMEDML